MTSQDEISAFISSSFRSVWSLELLLLLKGERRQWPLDELVTKLRASDLVVTQAVESLVAAGLAMVDDQGAAYAPVSKNVADLVEKTEKLYASRPDAVRRTIVSSAASGLTAFADAFRLRKG